MAAPQEQRSFTRITLDIPASLSFFQMEAYHIGAITNISLCGCFFPLLGGLPVGERCEVAISVAQGVETEQVTVTGTIVRSDAEGAGIRFSDHSPECRRQLGKVLSFGEDQPRLVLPRLVLEGGV